MILQLITSLNDLTHFKETVDTAIMLHHAVKLFVSTGGQCDLAQPKIQMMSRLLCNSKTGLQGSLCSRYITLLLLTLLYQVYKPNAKNIVKHQQILFLSTIISLCSPPCLIKSWIYKNGAVISKASAELLCCWVGMSSRNRTRRGRGVAVSHSDGDDKAFSHLSKQ